MLPQYEEGVFIYIFEVYIYLFIHLDYFFGGGRGVWCAAHDGCFVLEKQGLLPSVDLDFGLPQKHEEGVSVNLY